MTREYHLTLAGNPQEHTESLARRSAVADLLFNQFGNAVMTGPFAGLRISRNVVWDDGNIACKLLGSYEHELHPAFRRVLKRKPRVIMNIGCAEGYYAVGLARRLPTATVAAFDIEPASLDLARQTAAVNGVSNVVFFGDDDYSPITDRSLPLPDLVVMDCEGHEISYLNEARIELMAGCDLIVECHTILNHPEINVRDELIERMRATHDIEVITPSYTLGPFPMLTGILDDLQIVDAAFELRPGDATWLVCWSKQLWGV